jgi:hypothetical protein
MADGFRGRYKDARQLHVGASSEELFAQVQAELDAAGVGLDQL